VKGWALAPFSWVSLVFYPTGVLAIGEVVEGVDIHNQLAAKLCLEIDLRVSHVIGEVRSFPRPPTIKGGNTVPFSMGYMASIP